MPIRNHGTFNQDLQSKISLTILSPNKLIFKMMKVKKLTFNQSHVLMKKSLKLNPRDLKTNRKDWHK